MNSLSGPLQKRPSGIKKEVLVMKKKTIARSVASPAPSPVPSRLGVPSIKRNSNVSGPWNGSVNGKSTGYEEKATGRLLQKSATPQRACSEKRKRASPAQQPLESNSEGDSSDEDFLEPRKRGKTSVSAEPDMSRQIRSTLAFSEQDDGVFKMIHAADIASVTSGKYQPTLLEGPGQPGLVLRYPSASQPEMYELVEPKDKDDFKSLGEIARVINLVSEHYIPEEQKATFTAETTGILRKLERAQNWREADEFRKVVTEYNEVITKLRRNGSITKVLDNLHGLDIRHVEEILNQVYSRTVSLRVELLKQYENGTDNVYGELLPRFVSRILKQTRMKSNQVFVDLGSGVGNVVLQAALEIGCESWGCEMMENACRLATLQQKEFKARCRLWGIAPGEVHLEKGDFLKTIAIQNALKKADVVLINNQAFTPELNDSLKLLFLDLKEGCQVVSLKPFVPEGHKITERNIGSIMNAFKVDKYQYFSSSVSWTDNQGNYYIQTKDSSRVEALEKRLRS